MARTYLNPVVPGCHPDPSVCRVGGEYFLASSSFTLFPGVPLHRSVDLVNWELCGHALSRPSQLDLAGGGSGSGIWAPTLRWRDGRFWLVTTNMVRGGNLLVTAGRIEGPWSEPRWFDPDGWDPDLFFDEDGSAWVTRNGRDPEGPGYVLVQYRFDVERAKPLEAPRVVWRGAGGFGVEGPHLYRVPGGYLLLAAEGGTAYGHRVVAARAAAPDGPFEACPRNPVLTHRDAPTERLQCLGHADLVEGPDGSWWLVCLGTRNFDGFLTPRQHLGRETILAPVAWDAAGWPVVNGGRPIGVEMPAAPWMAELQPGRAAWVDDFERGGVLDPRWVALREPPLDVASLSERPGWLRLRGRAARLTDEPTPALVAVRLSHTEARWRVRFDFRPSSEHEEAGVAVYLAPRYHVSASLVRREGRRVLQLRRVADDWEHVVVQEVAGDAGPIEVEVEANPWAFLFSWRPEGGPWRPLGKAQAKFVSVELAGGFTGVLLALHASGGVHPATAPADFDRVEYIPATEPRWR